MKYMFDLELEQQNLLVVSITIYDTERSMDKRFKNQGRIKLHESLGEMQTDAVFYLLSIKSSDNGATRGKFLQKQVPERLLVRDR